jgi:hypothetical protein
MDRLAGLAEKLDFLAHLTQPVPDKYAKWRPGHQSAI